MGGVIHIDGSQGEGGGQILRTSLGLSLRTGRPVQIEGIRAGRAKPGLMRQHLTAVGAAAAVGGAVVTGDELGSTRLSFTPGTVVAGDYHFSVGTAGSAALVLQTVLPALLVASAPSRLTLEGGTHNPQAPPYDFLACSFAPLVRRLGAGLDVRLVRPGFFPAGGGCLEVVVTPAPRLVPFDLSRRGEPRSRRAIALVSRVPGRVAARELEVVRARLGFRPEQTEARETSDGRGPGNVLSLVFEHEHVTEVVTGFGERGVRAEVVAERACEEAATYLRHGAPVGEHLADQLVLLLALAGGGRFVTGPLTPHTVTNIEVVKSFLPVHIDVRPETDATWSLFVRGTRS